MDATTMPLANINKIKHDFPDLNFEKGKTFSWDPNSRTIYYEKLSSKQDLMQLLHEIAHAKLVHKNYQRDVQLIDIERSAWEYAINNLAPKYSLKLNMDDSAIQEFLDSYRDWLHKRSLCPQCDAVGLQKDNATYRCLSCNTEWRVNQAKSCQLKRYQIK